MWAGSRITNKLWNIYTISRRRWYIAAQMWKIDNSKIKIKIITFVSDRVCSLPWLLYSSCESKYEAEFIEYVVSLMSSSWRSMRPITVITFGIVHISVYLNVRFKSTVFQVFYYHRSIYFESTLLRTSTDINKQAMVHSFPPWQCQQS